jgi:energy-coupling factor transporter ATP-binding protein EcfA2
MRAELIEIWKREKKTVLFVTHDVEEAVQLSDRVVIMNRRPATISAVIEVKLPRPRDLDSPEYIRLRDEIFYLMGFVPAGIALHNDRGEGANGSAPATQNNRDEYQLQEPLGVGRDSD